MDESLVNSWVNPNQRLLEDDYKHVLTYATPPLDVYWDIPISPNSKYILVFESFDFSILDEKRLPMEFERLNLCQAKHSSNFKQMWSNDRPERVKNYKARKFMKDDFFQYTLIRKRDEYIRTQTDFVNMNPEEIFFIARVLQLKSEKHHKMKIACERACEFLKALVCDFGRIDA